MWIGCKFSVIPKTTCPELDRVMQAASEFDGSERMGEIVPKWVAEAVLYHRYTTPPELKCAFLLLPAEVRRLLYCSILVPTEAIHVVMLPLRVAWSTGKPLAMETGATRWLPSCQSFTCGMA